MAFIGPDMTLLRDLAKSLGLEGRPVTGIVLEVRVNHIAKLYIEEIIDDKIVAIDDLVGCVKRLTVERAKVNECGEVIIEPLIVEGGQQ